MINQHSPRRDFLKAAAASTLSSMIPFSARAASQSNSPNILLIVADDLGYEKLSCYGGLDLKTPQLDRMAKQGIRFSRTYTSPVCTPSRMSLYTGTYTPRHKFTEVLPVHLGTKKTVDFSTMPTTAHTLKKAGYTTSVTGKWQLATLEFHPDHCRHAGFDSWCVWQIWKDGAKTKRFWNATINQDGHIRDDIGDQFGSNVLTDYVIEQMKSANQQGKPFFIQHNMFLPHYPIIKTPMDHAKNREASLDHMIEYMDHEVGRLLDAIDELNLANDTIVFFVGDNGTDTQKARKTKQGVVTGGKRDLNDGGMHVPLIAYGPGRIQAGEVKHDLIDMTDLYSTICELAGIQIPKDRAIDGISFQHLLTGNGTGKRQWVTGGIYDDFVVFDGEWRLYHKNEKLIDCRNLPNEKPADMNSSEAIAAKKRLLLALNQLRSL